MINIGKIWNRLGLRFPSDYDHYEAKSVKRFREECQEHSIATDPIKMPNLCYLIPLLNLKGYHLELIKEDIGFTDVDNDKYIGSYRWYEKINRIVFSSTITSEEFCRCIQIIMHAHHFSESDNKTLPFSDKLDGRIEVKDSFFIFRALYIMRYHIRIRRNNDDLKDLSINSSQCLRQRVSPKSLFVNAGKSFHLKQLSDIVRLYKPEVIDESKITLEKNNRGLIFSVDIERGTSSMYDTSYTQFRLINRGFIIQNTKRPFTINRWKEDDAILTNGLIAYEVVNEDVLGDYLLLYLEKLVTTIVSKTEEDTLHVDILTKITIPIPPISEQYEIVKSLRLQKHKALVGYTANIIEESIENTITYILNSTNVNNPDSYINEEKQESHLKETVSSYAYRYKWVKGYYKKNGTYVQGHFRH